MADGQAQLWFDGIVWLDFNSGTQANLWAMAAEDWLRTNGKSLEITAELEVVLAAGTAANMTVSMFLQRTSMLTDRIAATGTDYWQSIKAADAALVTVVPRVGSYARQHG